MALAFAQTGTVDWVSLTSMTISTPITLMSRLAQSGVDQYTVELVKFYGQFLNLPSDYLGVVEAGLIQARKFGLSADVLYIGTGISLIPPMLAKTRGGVAFAAITMALRASFPANFTARVLSEWLCFFERPPEISIPSTSQLQALSNEVAACPIDPEIGRIIWGIEKLHEKAIGTHSPYSRNLTASPPAQDLAAAIYAITTIRPGQDAIIRFKSPQGPSPVWLAVFASKVVGLGVSYEIDTQVIWEQPQKHCAISGPRGRLRLVIGTLLDRGSHPEDHQLQLLRSACIEMNLQRQEANIQASFRIPPKLVVDRMLESLFSDPKQQGEAMQCIGKAAYHLSRKPAMWSTLTGPLVQYLFTKNGIRTALVMIGANSHDLDMWETEAEAKAQESLHIGKDGQRTDTFEDNLRNLFGMPFVSSFKKIHMTNKQSFPDDHKGPNTRLPPWSKSCLDTFQRILALWTVLAFVSPVDQNSISLDGRAVCRVIERSDGMFSAFESMWREHYRKLKGPEILITELSLIPSVGYVEFYLLQISAVHEMVFDIIGGRFDTNHTSNMNTTGIVNGGTFVVMSTLLEPNQPGPKDATIIFTGQGGIFINHQATSFLKSFDSGNDGPNSFTISPELQKFSYVHPYTPRAESFGDLTQTHLNMSLYVTGGPNIISVAWSVSGRCGPDILVDVLLSPHQILKAILATQFIDQFGRLHGVALSDSSLCLPEIHGRKDICVMNLESFLTTYVQDQTPSRYQLIMVKNNFHAQLLVMAYWRHGFEDTAGFVYLCPSEQLASFLPRVPRNSAVIVS